MSIEEIDAVGAFGIDPAALSLDEATVDDILSATDGDDVFGWHRLAKRHARQPYEWAHAGGYDVVVDAMLSGRDRTTRRNIQRLLQEDADRVMDLASARLLARMGIDPAVACALAASTNQAIEIHRGSRRLAELHLMLELAGCVVRVTLGPGAYWNSGLGVRLMNMPDSVVAGSQGKPLSAFVGHPALRGMDLTMGQTSDYGGVSWIAVEGSPRLSTRALLGVTAGFA